MTPSAKENPARSDRAAAKALSEGCWFGRALVLAAALRLILLLALLPTRVALSGLLARLLPAWVALPRLLAGLARGIPLVLLAGVPPPGLLAGLLLRVLRLVGLLSHEIAPLW